MGRANQPVDQTSADPDKEPQGADDNNRNNKFVKGETLAAHATHTDLLVCKVFCRDWQGFLTHIL